MRALDPRAMSRRKVELIKAIVDEAFADFMAKHGASSTIAIDIPGQPHAAREARRANDRASFVSLHTLDDLWRDGTPDSGTGRLKMGPRCFYIPMLYLGPRYLSPWMLSGKHLPPRQGL